ncbi:MAG: aldo/keto reductase [Bacteroidetes bacterium]|nr:aldo/keto reductase [Bacteroidota bacterium]MBS1931045.1 aldo/keto reductase [Bacteroidota bacterium]
MKYRQFGNTDLLVSEIGFGSWAIGGGAMIGSTAIGWGDVDDEISKKAIHRSLDLGINFFDTADIYGLGHSEEILGSLIGNKKEILIATKAGNVSRNNQFTVDYTKEYILKACENSLRRLKRNEIDYYQLHTARVDHLKNGECTDAMQQLVKEGKIRYWGLSLNTFEPETETEYMLQNNLGKGFQLVLNLLNQKSLPGIRAAAKNGYGIIARMPLQFGLLTGKFDKEVSFSENDHRKTRLVPEVINTANRALQPVWDLCKKYSVNKTQLALSYILSYPEVSTVIPGIRTAAHADANTSGLIQLDTDDMKLIEELGRNEFVSVMELIKKQG